MSLNTYKKFLIYKSVLENGNIDKISRKLKVSVFSVYKIKKEGFFKIKENQKVLLDYIEKFPFLSKGEIMKNLAIKKDFLYDTLKKFNVITFRKMNEREIEMVRFLLKITDFKTLNDFLYYQNFEVEPSLIDISDINDGGLFYIKYLKLYQKVQEGIDILDELERFLDFLKENNFNFTYLKALVLKFNVFILRKNYEKIVEILESIENLDNLISMSLRAKFYNSYLNALSLLGEFEKGFIILKKLKQIYKKISHDDKKEVLVFISTFYYNYGDIKSALNYSEKNSITYLLSLYAMGKYEKVIDYDFNFEHPSYNYLKTYAISLSYLFLGKLKEAIESFTSAYNISQIQFEDYLESYYIFLITYHKYLQNNAYLHYFNEYIQRLKNKVDKHFYAIVSKDIKNLKDTPKDMIIKYYFKGNLNKAILISNKYGLRTILYFLLIFHPKSYYKIARYNEFKNFINFSQKAKIRLYLLRKQPFFVYRNRKFYLRTKGISIDLIMLFINSRLNTWHFTKNEIKHIKYHLNLPIIEKQNEIILNADVYLDFKEAELSFRSGNFKKFKKLYKSNPWNLNYHPNEFINDIIKNFENFRKNTPN